MLKMQWMGGPSRYSGNTAADWMLVTDEDGAEMLKDVYTSAAALYDGGWRSTDAEQLMDEYELTQEEADKICEKLKMWEEL